jgi:hypothetical protein
MKEIQKSKQQLFKLTEVSSNNQKGRKMKISQPTSYESMKQWMQS